MCNPARKPVRPEGAKLPAMVRIGLSCLRYQTFRTRSVSPLHVRRNRNEHIAVGLWYLLVQTDPDEFETLGSGGRDAVAAAGRFL
jgi:hypothetical protein